jgi:hypothetical protein
MTDAMSALDRTSPLDRTSAAATSPGYIHWGAVIAGALVGAAVSLVLLAFGAGIGMSVASPSPTWRNASVPLALLSGLWIMIVALLSFATAGYVAGRMRARLAPAASDEVDFRDGMHGVIAWALAILLAGLLATSAARNAAPTTTSTPTAGATAASGEPAALSYEVDRLLRGERRPADPADTGEVRGEVGRLLSAALNERTYLPEDRTYLIRLVAARTGAPAADAERRVDSVVAAARERANRARRSAVLTTFMTAASLILGLAAAWFAAVTGGRHRDGETAPSMNWTLNRPMVR